MKVATENPPSPEDLWKLLCKYINFLWRLRWRLRLIFHATQAYTCGSLLDHHWWPQASCQHRSCLKWQSIWRKDFPRHYHMCHVMTIYGTWGDINTFKTDHNRKSLDGLFGEGSLRVGRSCGMVLSKLNAAKTGHLLCMMFLSQSTVHLCSKDYYMALFIKSQLWVTLKLCVTLRVRSTSS